MTFLQPFILWALPLILLPVVIHLINRMRHRTQQWAAMRFLISATRTSVNQAKLRQFLILLFRVLAVMALIFFVSRPLAGGWLGWMLAAAPDAIVILVDRSASMERQKAGATATAREQALQSIAQAAKEFQETSHLVLIDSATRIPQQLANAGSITNISVTAPTDTAADIPAMLQAAVKWIIDNRAGTAEIWIASDLQRSNWRPDDLRWQELMSDIKSLRQTVRIRVLAPADIGEANTSVALEEAARRDRSGQPELHLTADLTQSENRSNRFPIEVIVDGSQSQVDVVIDSEKLRWRHKVDLAQKTTGGWGKLQLPADANRRDNSAYFVYGPVMQIKAAVVSDDPESARYLRLAAAGYGPDGRAIADVLSSSQIEAGALADKSLLVWQTTAPGKVAADRILEFAEQGGRVIFFPPGRPDTGQFLNISWGEVQSAPPEQMFRVLRWDEDQGPLAKTDEGWSLPLPQTVFGNRQMIAGARTILAAYEDGAPFLSRVTLGRGEIYFCASLPRENWSNLSDGPVLVPMLQRLLISGSRRLQQTASIACGELSPADRALRWNAVDSTTPKDIQLHAGVYQSGERLIAVNRPLSEDDPETADPDRLEELMAGVPFQFFQEERSRSDALQGEFWRVFLIAMLLFLIFEAILILPARSAKPAAVRGQSVPAAAS